MGLAGGPGVDGLAWACLEMLGFADFFRPKCALATVLGRKKLYHVSNPTVKGQIMGVT